MPQFEQNSGTSRKFHDCFFQIFFRIYSVSPPPTPSVFYGPPLQIICCHIARHYVKNSTCARGLKKFWSLWRGGGGQNRPLFFLSNSLALLRKPDLFYQDEILQIMISHALLTISAIQL